MASLQQLVEHGESFADFVNRGLPEEIQAVQRVRQQLAGGASVAPHTVDRVKAVQQRFYLLVAGEMWCPDCQLNLTAFEWLCQLQPLVNMAIISKGRAEDDLQTRLGLERISVPLVLVLNADFEEVGRFIERPQRAAEGWPALKADYRAGLFLDDAVTELLAIFDKASG